MFLQKLTVIVAFAIVSAQADQTWYNLKTTWGPTPLNGFYDQPRTVEEANNAGWVQVSNDCTEGARYVVTQFFDGYLDLFSNLNIVILASILKKVLVQSHQIISKHSTLFLHTQ